MSYIDTLELTRDPFASYVDEASFFPYSQLMKTVAQVRHLMEADPKVVLITGDPGSGKTLMVKQILAVDEDNWRVATLSLPSLDSPLRAYTTTQENRPVIMVDDAHLLEPEALAALVKLTTNGEEVSPFKQVVLTGLPHTAVLLDTLRHLVSGSDAIKEIPLPSMGLEEMQTYLSGRLRSAGHLGECPLSSGQIQRIHCHSGGFPGAANTEAAKELEQTHGGEDELPPPKKGLLGRLFGR